MYKFDKVLTTTKKYPGKNSDQFIILHHTGGGNFNSNCKLLSGSKGLSVQFIVGPKGETAKIGQPTDILWHAGDSQWGNLKGMNNYAMGIEVVGPDKKGGFSDAQYSKVVELVKYLMQVFEIPIENILKHADVTWSGNKDKKLRDGKTPNRKTDISRAFRADRGFSNFDTRRKCVFK